MKAIAHRIRLDGDACVYCGENATEYDHFPPRSFTNRGYLLPACKSCNAIAGHREPFDFERRARYVTKRIRDREARLLRTPSWSDDELGELGHNLWSEVARWQNKLARARRRIAWNAVRYIRSIDKGNATAALFVEDELLELIRRG